MSAAAAARVHKLHFYISGKRNPNSNIIAHYGAANVKNLLPHTLLRAVCTIVAITSLCPNKFEICGDIWNVAIRWFENFSIKLEPAWSFINAVHADYFITLDRYYSLVLLN